MLEKIKIILENAYEKFHRFEFLTEDPLQIPHRFHRLQDQEIMGFLAATLAWGQRKTIIKKCEEIISLFDGAPYEFVLHHTKQDIKRLESFQHRTFNGTDLIYFVTWLSGYYRQHNSLEDTFARHLQINSTDVSAALVGFHRDFFSLPFAPARTRKHIATPERKSTCKRLNMLLRWFVRNGDVDLGIWKKISPSQLICPLDVHTERTARFLGLLTRKRTDWLAALELTQNLRLLDAQDPVKYDFALFGLSIERHFIF
ncbi:MAG: TIGR02757 family protein [Cytophagales bacterium]|nr:TIGR02757 family protein [Cytophagales bacterium]MDW8383886.1 TIGR02757 family protein [Flammeovirgaceae bacterium]